MKTLARLRKRKVPPTLVNGTVPPRRVLNSVLRPREYLTGKEIERLIDAAKVAGRRCAARHHHDFDLLSPRTARQRAVCADVGSIRFFTRALSRAARKEGNAVGA